MHPGQQELYIDTFIGLLVLDSFTEYEDLFILLIATIRLSWLLKSFNWILKSDSNFFYLSQFLNHW